MISMRRTLLFGAFTALLSIFVLASSAQAVTISVNTDWGSGNFLANSDVAGVVPAANWNNVDLSAGTPVTGGMEASLSSLIDDTGFVTPVTFRAYGSAPNGNDTVSGGGPDATMMTGGFRSSIEGHGGDAVAGQLEFTNLLDVHTSYDVYIYIGEGNPLMGSYGDAGVASTTVNSGAGSADSGFFISSGAGDYTNTDATDIPAGYDFIAPYRTRDVAGGGFNYDGAYNISTGTSDEGNYIKLSGLTLDTLVLTTVPGTNTASDGAGGFFETVTILGIQINSECLCVFDPADTDKDGDVDTADLTTMFQNFTGSGGMGKTLMDGDTDKDGDVDTADITVGLQNFTGALSGLATVPEPGTLTLSGLGMVSLLIMGLRKTHGRSHNSRRAPTEPEKDSCRS